MCWERCRRNAPSSYEISSGRPIQRDLSEGLEKQHCWPVKLYHYWCDKFSKQDIKDKLLNPVWHIHNGVPPKEKSIMPFSVLLNLVGTSNATDKEVLWKFIKKYKKDIKISDYPILDSLVEYALKYFKDVVKPNKKHRTPNESA